MIIWPKRQGVLAACLSWRESNVAKVFNLYKGLYFRNKYDNFYLKIKSLKKGVVFLKDAEIVEVLRKESEEYRKLDEEHRRLDKDLASFDSKRYLTPEEEVERKKIQKQKLFKKDRMAELIREYKNLIKIN